jgi:segregation and condensation protein A
MAVIVVRPEPVPVMISFGEGHRAEDATHVRLESFDGPLAMLLALIEQRQLDVLTVRLGDLAPAFLDALAGLETRRLPLLSSFVSISAQLILIKSRAVLPRLPQSDRVRLADDEGLDPEEELRQRLILYRLYRDAGMRLAGLADAGAALFHREPVTALAAARSSARSPTAPPFDPVLLVEALRASTRLAPEPVARRQVLPRSVTLEDRVALLRRALSRAPEIVLQELLRNVHDRVVIAVTFMALLEMVKSHEVDIDQAEPWGPISVRPVADAR